MNSLPGAGRLRALLHGIWPDLPLPYRLPDGRWWLARGDAMSDAVLAGNYEAGEARFLERNSPPGATVLDVGAHAGYFTLLLSRCVGPSGRVIAFEPSPRERWRLRSHLDWNGTTNVTVEPYALSDAEGETPFFLVEGRETGMNSLRPPNLSPPAFPGRVREIRVPTARLDDRVRVLDATRVALLKIDAEGAEWSILRGGEALLGRDRPVLLVELVAERTAPWGYAPADLLAWVEARGYRWHRILPDGTTVPLPTGDPPRGNCAAWTA